MNIPTPEEVHALAVSKGWYEGPERILPELLCLVHSEISEALEGFRNHIPEGEKGCVSEELADAVIRIWDMSAFLGLDIEAAINKKHGFNKTRPHRHGGKRC